jgi:protein subunit release factor B
MGMIHELPENELSETFERSSGPGGQNVNKVASKVILKHLPTGMFVVAQDSRSQAKNRQLARERLLQALNDREQQRESALRNAREKTRRQNAPRPKKIKAGFVQEKRRRNQLRQMRKVELD